MNTTKVADLTVDKLKGIIREIVAQTFSDLLSDPDEGLTSQAEENLAKLDNQENSLAC